MSKQKISLVNKELFKEKNILNKKIDISKNFNLLTEKINENLDEIKPIINYKNIKYFIVNISSLFIIFLILYFLYITSIDYKKNQDIILQNKEIQNYIQNSKIKPYNFFV